MAKLEVGVGAAADAAYNTKRKEEMAASEAAAEIQRMKRGYLIKVSVFKRAGFAMVFITCLHASKFSDASPEPPQRSSREDRHVGNRQYIGYMIHSFVFTQLPFTKTTESFGYSSFFNFFLFWTQLLDEEKSEERLLKNAQVGSIYC